MCKLGLVFLFSLITGSNYAQGYFVLLQSGNRQPFYVRLGTQVSSSTPGGHLILSQLKDSTYTVSVGFQNQPGVEQTYALTPSQKDQELEIRDHGEAGWGLYDAQAQSWLTAISRSGGHEEVRAIGIRRDDAFSRMMAGVVHDTAVLYNDYAGSELATAAPTGTNNKTDTATAHITPVDTPAIQPEAVAVVPPPARPDSTVALQPKTDTPAAQPVTAAATSDTAATQAPTAAVKPDISATQPDTPATQPVTAGIQPAGSSKPDTPAAQPVTAAKTDTVQTATKLDTAAATQSNTAAATEPNTAAATPLFRPVSGSATHKPLPALDSPAHKPLYRPAPEVVKLSERKLTRNLRLVYADKGRGVKSDTVVVIIPLDTPRVANARPRMTGPDSARTIAARPRIVGPDSARPAKSRSASPDSSRTARPRTPSSDSIRAVAAKPKPSDSSRTAARAKAPDFDTPANVRTIVPTPVSPPADKGRTGDSAKKPATKSSLPYVNSDCHAFATDYDVDKLRVKMLQGAKDEDRIAAALKVFKTKCFFTRQLRALSEVFTTDASKYRFFETAYPFAADEHFRELVTLLADPVYANKFKTLTGGR